MRITTVRFPLWSHDKEAFAHIFATVDKNRDDFIKPFLGQTKQQAITLAGNFPNNISEWIWSAPSQDDSVYVMMCRLDTGAYALCVAQDGTYMMDIYGGWINVQVTTSIDELIERGLTDSWYALYISKTTDDASAISRCIDPYPWIPPNTSTLDYDIRMILLKDQLASEAEDVWTCRCVALNNSHGKGNYRCVICGAARPNFAGTEYLIADVRRARKLIETPFKKSGASGPTVQLLELKEQADDLKEKSEIAQKYLDNLLDHIKYYPEAEGELCGEIRQMAALVVKFRQS